MDEKVNISANGHFSPEARKKAAETRGRLKDTSYLASSVIYATETGKVALLKSYLDGVPERFRLRVVKALNNELSVPDRLRLKCVECCGYEDHENRINNCVSWRCPIWAVRPYQTKEGTEDENSVM